MRSARCIYCICSFFYCYHGGYIEVLTGTGKANGTAERSFIEDVCFMHFFVDIVNYSS